MNSGGRSSLATDRITIAVAATEAAVERTALAVARFESGLEEEKNDIVGYWSEKRNGSGFTYIGVK